MAAVHIPGIQAPPSTAYQIVDVPENYRDVIQRHGIPGTFVGPSMATSRIKDGQRIRVDGGRGVVTII